MCASEHRSPLLAFRTRARVRLAQVGRWLLSDTRRIVAFLAIVMLGSGALILAYAGVSEGDPIEVSRGELRLAVDVEGELASVRAAQLGPPPVNVWGEFKISFLAPEGASVKAGEPVVGFDAQPIMRELERQQAELEEVTKKVEEKEIDTRVRGLALQQQLAQAEARLRKARLKAETPPEVVKRIEAEKAALDVQGAEAEVAGLEAEIEALRATGSAEVDTLRNHQQRASARVASLARDMAAMMVAAPQDGIVIYKSDRNDEKPKVGDSVWAMQSVATLPDLSEMKAAGMVDEADGGRIHVGQAVTLRLEVRPDLDLRGRVTSIGSTVQRKSWRVPVKVYRVEIALERTDPTFMRPAMRFRGEIEVERIPDVLLAPRQAVFLRATGPIVWVRRPWGYVERSVKLGRRNHASVEVLEGVGAGDQLARVDLRAPSSATQSHSAREGL